MPAPQCPACAAAVGDARFCASCGYDLQRRPAPAPAAAEGAAEGAPCVLCGARSPPTARFCAGCGYEQRRGAPHRAAAAQEVEQAVQAAEEAAARPPRRHPDAAAAAAARARSQGFLVDSEKSVRAAAASAHDVPARKATRELLHARKARSWGAFVSAAQTAEQKMQRTLLVVGALDALDHYVVEEGNAWFQGPFYQGPGADIDREHHKHRPFVCPMPDCGEAWETLGALDGHLESRHVRVKEGGMVF